MSEDFDRLMRALRLTDTAYCEDLRAIATEKTIEKGTRLSESEKQNVMFLMSGRLQGGDVDPCGGSGGHQADLL